MFNAILISIVSLIGVVVLVGLFIQIVYRLHNLPLEDGMAAFYKIEHQAEQIRERNKKIRDEERAKQEEQEQYFDKLTPREQKAWLLKKQNKHKNMRKSKPSKELTHKN